VGAASAVRLAAGPAPSICVNGDWSPCLDGGSRHVKQAFRLTLDWLGALNECVLLLAERIDELD